MKRWVFCLLFFCVLAKGQAQDAFVEKLFNLTSEKQLVLEDTVLLKFDTFHTQGLTKVGDSYFLSSVDVKRWPRKYKVPNGKIDRDTGEGIGRIFRFDKTGNLTGEITIGTDSIYHPGGIDFDGKYIWIPVCEYRPFGKSIMYRMNPETMRLEKMWECNDALGAVICKSETEVIAMNWDSEKFYKWKRKNESWSLESIHKNNSHTFRFQDGLAISDTLMLCSGLNRWSNGLGLGGIQLINSANYLTVYQLPVSLKAKRGGVLNNNPFFAEMSVSTLKLYFVPEDNSSLMYVYRFP